MNLLDQLRETALADNDLLALSDRKGDVFLKARDVDFFFTTGEEERAQDLAEFVNGLNYGRAKVVEAGQDGEQTERFGVEVLIFMPINQHVACAVSGFMLCLSRLFQVDYKGWGSVSQKQQ